MAPLIAPFDPNHIGESFGAPPGGGHILGTDELGRDVLSRLLYGARASLAAGLGAVGIAAVLGTVLGLLAGFFGGLTDMAVMRAADVFMSFPSLMLTLVISAILGPGLGRLILTLGFLGWPPFARLVRGNVLSIKELDYIKEARALGFGSWRIIIFHILPNTLSPIIVQAVFAIAGAITLESSLSFLGMGVTPPAASWGNMLSAAQSLSALTGQPWLWVPPGLMILLTVLAFNFAGEGISKTL
jgi:peptide/nickel transport system permease protein